MANSRQEIRSASIRLDEDILEVKEEIYELEELLEIKNGWSWKRRSDVYDERLSKLERLDELFERRDSNNG